MSTRRIIGNLIQTSLNRAKGTGSKCINKFGKVPTAVGLITSPTLATLCLSSGNPFLMSLFVIPGSMTYTAITAAATTKMLIKTPSYLAKIIKSCPNNQNISIFMMK